MKISNIVALLFIFCICFVGNEVCAEWELTDELYIWNNEMNIYDPSRMDYNSANNKLYIVNAAYPNIFIVDVETMSVVGSIDIGSDENTYYRSIIDMFVDSNTNSIYLLSHQELYVIDGRTNSVVKIVELNKRYTYRYKSWRKEINWWWNYGWNDSFLYRNNKKKRWRY